MVMFLLPFCLLSSIGKPNPSFAFCDGTRLLGVLRRLVASSVTKSAAIDIFLWGFIARSQVSGRGGLCVWPLVRVCCGFPTSSFTGGLFSNVFWLRFVSDAGGVDAVASVAVFWVYRAWSGYTVYITNVEGHRTRRKVYGVYRPMGVVTDVSLPVISRTARYMGSSVFCRRNYLRLQCLSLRRTKGIRGFRTLSKFFVRGFLLPEFRYFPRLCGLSRWFSLRTFLRVRRRVKGFYVQRFRRRLRGFKRVFPSRVARRYRFVRKFRALFTVRAQHTNLFFTIRQGSNYFLASTGMYDDLKHGTKRKRTLLAGWFLADRLFERVQDDLKKRTIFRIDLYGRTSGRRGIWFSWRTKPWRLFLVRSRTPIAYNGTRGCRRRRL